jgi:hypothetical protein
VARVVQVGIVLAVAVAARPALAGAAATPPTLPSTERDSLASAPANTEGNADSAAPVISALGRYVAFVSSAANLVPGDTNQALDVFMRDRQSGLTERVSISSSGVQADAASYGPLSLADGGHDVAFGSAASDLVPGVSGSQLYLRDRFAPQTSAVSIASDGTPGNGASHDPSLSGDGRYIVFDSTSTNLDASATNTGTAVFIHDRAAGTTSQLSLAVDQALSPAISNDGTTVAWAVTDPRCRLDEAIVVYSLASASRAFVGCGHSPHLSGDGATVAYMVRDLSIADGPLFGSGHVVLRDVSSGATAMPFGSTLVRVFALSGDGLHVAATTNPSFTGYCTGQPFTPCVTQYTESSDVYEADVLTGSSFEVSKSTAGVSGGLGGLGDSGEPSISWDGTDVAFSSTSPILVPNDNNGAKDVFVHDRGTTPGLS